MDTLVAVLAAVVVVLAGAKLLQRRRRDEIRSIHHYHDRLDTLQVEPHDRGGSVRVVDGQPAPTLAPSPGRPRLDPESAHVDTTPPALPQEVQTRHDRAWALERMQPRARVDTASILIVATVVFVLIAIALVGYEIQHRRTKANPSATTTTSTLRSGAYVARTLVGGTAVYDVPAGTFEVTVRANHAAVWTQAATPPRSTHVVSRVVAAGGSTTYDFRASGSVELGAPRNAAITLNGVSVNLPAGYPAPLTLEFHQPS